MFVRGDAQANEKVMNKVRGDKLNEVLKGHDGSWVNISFPNKERKILKLKFTKVMPSDAEY